jgi:putative peptidoglycan lipid II flippase
VAAQLSQSALQERHDAGAASDVSASFASVARGSRAMAGWVLASRITGFGRVAVTAAVLGPTYFGNLFQFSNALPILIYGLLSGSLISAMLVPPLVRCLDAKDRAGARQLANGFLGTLLAIFLTIAILCIAATPLLLQVMTATVQDAEVQREQLRLGWPLLAMMLPQLLLYAVSGVCVAVQQAKERFALAAGASAAENVGVVAVLGVFALLYGTGTEIRDVSDGQILLLGLGATGAVALCTALQWWGASRTGLRLVPSAGWRQPEIRRMFRTGASSVGYTGLSAATLFGMLTLAGSVPGGVAAFQIAASLVYLPAALTAGPLSAVLLPQLSRCFHEGSLHEFAATYRSSVRLLLFALLPAALLMVTIPQALARAMAFGEMAAPAGVTLIAACVAGRGLGVLGEAILVVGTSASYARRDVASPLQAMALLMGTSLVGMVLAGGTSSPETLMWMLGATAAAAGSVAALYLHWRQLRKLPAGTGRHLRSIGANLIAAAIASGTAWLIVHHVAGAAVGPWERMQVAGGATLAAAATYLLLHLVRGSEEMALLLPLPARLRHGLRQFRAGRPAAAPPRMSADTRS